VKEVISRLEKNLEGKKNQKSGHEEFKT